MKADDLKMNYIQPKNRCSPLIDMNDVQVMNIRSGRAENSTSLISTSTLPPYGNKELANGKIRLLI